MKTLEEIEKYAKEHYVPIARKPLVEYMITLIKDNHYGNMLEIGTGIAYTCVALCQKTDIKITTIEYSKDRYDESLKNIQDFNYESRIDMIFGDACMVEFQEPYDLIFIDAAKLKNKLFFLKFSPLLTKHGTIIIDNMNLDDFAKHVKKEKYEKYHKNNEELMEFIATLEDFTSQYYDIGDGILKINRK